MQFMSPTFLQKKLLALYDNELSLGQIDNLSTYSVCLKHESISYGKENSTISYPYSKYLHKEVTSNIVSR